VISASSVAAAHSARERAVRLKSFFATASALI
jgi:hypothetical protein